MNPSPRLLIFVLVMLSWLAIVIVNSDNSPFILPEIPRKKGEDDGKTRGRNTEEPSPCVCSRKPLGKNEV
jgi:hypothetical protein